MISWIIVIVALLVSSLWAAVFLKQLKSGLAETALQDRFAWGLYVQGFFFFSALAGGILTFMAVPRSSRSHPSDLWSRQALRSLWGALPLRGCCWGLISGNHFAGSRLSPGRISPPL